MHAVNSSAARATLCLRAQIASTIDLGERCGGPFDPHARIGSGLDDPVTGQSRQPGSASRLGDRSMGLDRKSVG